MNFTAAKSHIIRLLAQGLPEGLYYHGLHHTLDVVAAADRLATAEQISVHERELLLTAALLHDAGFMNQYEQHEAAGCEIARKVLPQFAYTQEQVTHICDMIMATQIPQSPQDHLGQILCDADLDYLGRNDFFQIGETLYQEFKERGIIQNEESWNRLQVNFLSKHAYFTPTAIATRRAAKINHLQAVEAIVAGYAA